VGSNAVSRARDGPVRSILPRCRSSTPDGATLLTFIGHDRKHECRTCIEERNQAPERPANQALRDARRLRNDFVHHVSLRAAFALTDYHSASIQLLDDPAIGPLNTKQREYAAMS